MEAKVIVVAGPALCGKTTRLLAEHRHELARRRVGSALWLAPTQRGSLAVRGRLLDGRLPGCFSPGVMTFDQFAAAIIQASQDEVRPLSRGMKRSLVRELIRSHHTAGKLRHFAPIVEKPGFVDLVCQWIGELKRVEIWPDDFQAACRQRGMSLKDTELLAIYREYQEQLAKFQLYDAEGRFWNARSLMTQGQRRPFQALHQVIVDGFTDFTRTQHEMLQELAKRAERIWITLPLEEEGDRADLFAKCNRTLEQLKERHPRLEVRRLPRPERPVWPALAHLERELFKNPREVTQATDAAGLAVLGASGQIGELEHVARKIKKLLTSGLPESGGRPVPPGDVAVVFRSLAKLAPLAAEVFARFGVPVAIEKGESLGASPAIASFLSLLRLDAEDWPFRRLLGVLHNNYFQPLPFRKQAYLSHVADEIVRHWEFPCGKAALLERATAMAATCGLESPIDASARERDNARLASRAKEALPLLQLLADALAKLPPEASAAGWVERLTALADELGFLSAIDKDSLPDKPSRDRLAWNRLLEELIAEESLASWLDRPARKVAKKDLLPALEEIVRQIEIPSRHEEAGRVRVLAASSARALSIPYLFFAGLSEKAMPAGEREGRLYGEWETADLHRRGLPLVLRHQRQQDEMLLFYEVVTRATRFLHVSYPALDEKAQPLLPSPYVGDVTSAFADGALKNDVAHDLSPLPSDRTPLCATDWRLLAVDRALAGHAELLAALRAASPTPGLGDNVVASIGAIQQRAVRDAFGPFEGMCESDAMQLSLKARFGGERHWSASDLETYAACPYKFFAGKVLRLQERQDAALRIDDRARGANLHATLARLHQRVNDRTGRPSTPAEMSAEAYALECDSVLAMVLRPAEANTALEAALCEIDRRVLRKWIDKYLKQHADYDARWESFEIPMRPAHFETAFGQQNSRAEGPTDALTTLQPLVLTNDGEQIQLAGRIDRIDRGQAGGTSLFSVIDYKSGGKSLKKEKQAFDGLHLQLDLYALAVEELLLKEQGAVPLQTGYWRLKTKGYEPWHSHAEAGKMGLQALEGAEKRRNEVVAKVFEIVRGIRAGRFPVFSLDDKCTSYCEFKTICRINHIRSLGKDAPP